MKIECQNELKVQAGVEFQTVLLPPTKQSPETAEKVKKWDQGRAEALGPPPSVLIIGIDSISRLHMKRQLPETQKFLDANDFVEMKGYTKIGENTFPNIMGAIGGMSPGKYSCWPAQLAKLDDCPLIWKNFSENGYLTAFLEDAPGIAIFNYEKTGFGKLCLVHTDVFEIRYFNNLRHKHRMLPRPFTSSKYSSSKSHIVT